MPLKLFSRARKPADLPRNPPAFRYEYSEELPPPVPVASPAGSIRSPSAATLTSPSSTHLAFPPASPSCLSPTTPTNAAASTSSLMLNVPADPHSPASSSSDTFPRRRKPSIKAVIGLPIARAFGAAAAAAASPTSSASVASKSKVEDLYSPATIPRASPELPPDTVRSSRWSRPMSAWIDVDSSQVPPASPAPRSSSSAPATPLQGAPLAAFSPSKSVMGESTSLLGRWRGRRDRSKTNASESGLSRKSSTSTLQRAFTKRSSSPPPPLPAQSNTSRPGPTPVTTSRKLSRMSSETTVAQLKSHKTTGSQSSGFELKAFRNVRNETAASSIKSRKNSSAVALPLEEVLPATSHTRSHSALPLSSTVEPLLAPMPRARHDSATSFSSIDSSPRMSAAAFRDAVKSRSSLTQNSYSSDIGLPLTASALEAHSPSSSRNSSRPSSRLGLRAVSDIGLSSTSRTSAALAAAAKNPSAAAVAAAAAKTKRMRNQVPLISRIPASSGQVNYEEVLAPPRPAFYGMGSQNKSNSSLSGDSSGRRTPGSSNPLGILSSANQSKASLASVKSIPRSGLLSPTPQLSPGSRRSSFEGWQTAQSSEDHSDDAESGEDEVARKTRLASVNLFGAHSGSNVASPKASPALSASSGFPASSQVTKSPILRSGILLPPAQLGPSPSSGTSDSALVSDDDDEVPLSQLLTKAGRATGSFHSVNGSGFLSSMPNLPIMPLPERMNYQSSNPTNPSSPAKLSLRAMADTSAAQIMVDRDLQQSPTPMNQELPEGHAPTHQAAASHIGRSVSALSLASTTSHARSESVPSLPQPATLFSTSSAPLVPTTGSLAHRRQSDIVPSLPTASSFIGYIQPRGNSPASSSSGSGSWTAPLTPRDSVPHNIAVGKPRVSFDPNVVERDGPKRIGKPLFSASLGVPPIPGIRSPNSHGPPRQTVDGKVRDRESGRSNSGGRRSVSESSLPPPIQDMQHLISKNISVLSDADDEKDEDEALGMNIKRSSRTYQFPAPPGVDPMLYASLPPDQKMQLHQRSQMMMQMMAAQAAQMHAMTMSQGNSMPTLLTPQMSWETGSAIGSSIGNGGGGGGSMLGVGHRQVPSVPTFSSPQMMGYGYPMNGMGTPLLQMQQQQSASVGGGGYFGAPSSPSMGMLSPHMPVGMGPHWGSASAVGIPTGGRSSSGTSEVGSRVVGGGRVARSRPMSTTGLGYSNHRLSWTQGHPVKSTSVSSYGTKTRQQTNLRYETGN